MASDANISSLPPRVCMFWKLPLELRDIIYELVYGGPRQFKFQSKAYCEKKNQNLTNYEPAFPESPVAHLDANKQYFEESLRVWMRGTTFIFRPGDPYSVAWDASNAVNRYILEQISSVVIEGPYYHTIYGNNMPHLLDLTTEFYHFYIERGWPGKSPFADDYSDVDLASVKAIKELLEVRGLRSFHITKENYFQDKTAEERKRWDKLQDQTEKLVRDVCTKPHEPSVRPRTRVTFLQALKLTMDEKASGKRQVAAGVPQPKVIPASLSDGDVPQSEDAVLRLLLTRPKAFTKWIEDVKTRAAAQGSTSVQQRDKSALPEPPARKPAALRTDTKTKTGTQSKVPSSLMTSSPNWHFTKHVDKDTSEEVVRCAEHTKPNDMLRK